MSLALRAALRGDALARGDTDIAGEPGECQGADEEVAQVELPPAEAVSGGGGKRVVVVVPPFAEAKDADERVVAAVVAAVEGPRAPEVADGVHGPGEMVD